MPLGVVLTVNSHLGAGGYDALNFALGEKMGNNTMESVVILLIGVLVIAFAVAAYILCIFPSNPTDDLVAAMHEKGIRLGIAKIGLAAKVHSKI